MTAALLLSLVLSASPQTFFVELEPSSVNATWKDALVAGAAEEVRASHGRQAFTRQDSRHASARFALAVRVAPSGSTALVSVKIAELSSGKVLRSSTSVVRKATKESCVAEVRAAVRKELEALPVDLPAPEPKKD